MNRLCYLLVMLTVVAGALGINPTAHPAAASSSHQAVNALAMAIDNRASTNGLPSGDGIISPAENAISEVIWNDINSFNAGLDEFEATSPANTAAIDEVEITVTDYYVKVFDPASRPDAQADMATSLQQLTEEISNELYLDHLTDELVNDIVEYQIWEELIEATEQYLLENEAANNPQAVGETIKQGATDYIQNEAKIKRKNINRKRVENMVEYYVPSQLLPTNGMWRIRPYTASFTGDCDSIGGGIGMGDGDDGTGGLDDPGEPLCGFENPGGLPFITWQYDMHMYLPGTANVYSGMPEVGYTASHSSFNGPTDGSQRSERTIEYEVISPDLIRVHYLIRYSGGCAIEATYEIELVTADESVCPDLSSYDPTKGDTEPVEIIPGQGQQSIPVRSDDELPIEEPPVNAGPYTAGLPMMPPAADCEMPQLTEVRLLDQGSGVLVLDYGTGQQTLYRDGTGYTFDSGFGPSGWQNINLYFNGDGSGYLTWNKTTTSGKMCNLSQDLYLPGTAPVNTTPVEPTGDAGDAPIVGGTFTDGTYGVEWDTTMTVCPADMQALLPTYAQVTVTFTNDSTVVLSYDGGEMVLTDSMGLGTFMYMDMTASPMITVGLTNLGGMDVLLSWMAMTPTGASCMTSATFTAQ